MRFLHTSDWHVGKPLRNRKRDEEYEAALMEVLDIARQEEVDCVLVAGDVFDSAVPPTEAERIVFHFFGELVGSGIPAVVIAGNHDHPRRWNAYAPLLRHLGIEVIGEPVTVDEGGVVRVASRDESETAVIAALPWVSERKVRDFESLMEEGKHLEQYADGVTAMMKHLCGRFTDDTVNILMAHVFVDESRVGGPDSGERPLHMGQAYAVKRQNLPANAQYIALGHIHMPQSFGLANAHYSGSLLRCDFGEAGQPKGVNVVDVSPGRKASVRQVPLSTPKQLVNVGKDEGGVTIEQLKHNPPDPDSYAKVWVKVDRPFPGLAEQVREVVPNAVDIVVQHSDTPPDEPSGTLRRMDPEELFRTYYERTHQAKPAEELVALFNRIRDEVSSAPD